MPKNEKPDVMLRKIHAEEWKIGWDAENNSWRRMKCLIWCRENLMMKNEKIKNRIKKNICLEFTVHGELNKILQNFVLAHLIVLSPNFFYLYWAV